MEIIVFGNRETRAAVSKYIESMSLEGQVWNLGVLKDSDVTFSSHNQVNH